MRATGAGTRSCLQPGIQTLGTPETPFASPPPHLLSAVFSFLFPPAFLVPRAKLWGRALVTREAPPKKTDFAAVIPLLVSWGMSLQWPSLMSPSGTQSVETAVWVLARSVCLMEAF